MNTGARYVLDAYALLSFFKTSREPMLSVNYSCRLERARSAW